MENTNQSVLARSRSRICAVSLMLLYTEALVIYDLKEETLETPLYLLAAVSSCLAGCVLVSGIRNYRSGNRRKCMIQAAAALFLLLAGRSWNLIGASPAFVFNGLVLNTKYVLSVFWPFAALMAVKISGYGLAKDRYSDVFSASMLYVLLVSGGIWVLEDVMVPQAWDDIDWMITELVFLAGLSYLVFFKEYIVKLTGTGRRILAGGTAAVLNLAGLGLMIYKSPRLRVILYSLGLRLFDSAGSIRDVNWLHYRMEAVKVNWSGELEPGLNRIGHYLKDGYAWFTWKKNPLVCLNAEYGKLVILLILILFAAMMFFAGRIAYQDEYLSGVAWYIRAEFIMAAVFSTLNEFFLVQAGAGMGCYFPLLGHGALMIPLLSILYKWNDLRAEEVTEITDETGMVGGTGIMDETEAGPNKPKWKKAGAFTAMFLLVPILFWRIWSMPFAMDSYAGQTEQESTVPGDTNTYQAWKEGCVSYYGKRIQGTLEGFGGEEWEDQFFFGDHTKGQRDGYGLLKAADGSAWMGRCEEGTMCEGFWLYGDGSWEMTSKADGMADDDKNLKVIQYGFGDYYYGEVKDGKPEGYGQYYSPKQEYFYVGEFEDGIRSGRGACYIVESSDDIFMIVGTWENGVFSGTGILAEDWETGFEEGQWFQDKDGVTGLVDGSWFYKNDIKPRGTHIYYRSDGRWYYGEAGPSTEEE